VKLLNKIHVIKRPAGHITGLQVLSFSGKVAGLFFIRCRVRLIINHPTWPNSYQIASQNAVFSSGVNLYSISHRFPGRKDARTSEKLFTFML